MSEPELSSRQALLILNGLRRVGPVSLTRLLDAFGNDPGAILRASRPEWMRIKGIGPEAADSLQSWADFPLEKEEKNLLQRNGAFLVRDDDEYPALLHEIHDSPLGLYRLGEIPSEPCVAIVGTRKPTLYGTGMARKLAGDLAQAGFCIVSGMARGIDTAAHEGALAAGGKTVAVLGSGLDIIYPPENLDLFKRICGQGAVLSEFPFGRRADRQSFPMRNRVVSGMCEGVLVVESAAAGGSLITARFAGEQGRQVFAVPGRVDQPSSAGCHQLIRDGAVLVRSAMDLVEELAASIRFPSIPPQLDHENHPENSPEPSISSYEGNEALVMHCFADGAILRIDDFADLMDLAPHELQASLSALELKRALVRRADGRFEAV